ncbi:hypothetical protein B0J17DRAFT_714701 [Rhizoctonia solani]|nr:hypothetical protein B0J17DRAFT_714701 [Rhizoctonia solani]
MIIPITTPPESKSGLPQHPRLARLGNELFLLEMQGKLEVEGPKEGAFVGVLGLDDSVRQSNSSNRCAPSRRKNCLTS